MSECHVAQTSHDVMTDVIHTRVCCYQATQDTYEGMCPSVMSLRRRMTSSSDVIHTMVCGYQATQDTYEDMCPTVMSLGRLLTSSSDVILIVAFFHQATQDTYEGMSVKSHSGIFLNGKFYSSSTSLHAMSLRTSSTST